MSIRLKCQQCGSVVKVAEKYAGKRVKCPGCQGPIEVPAGVDCMSKTASVSAPTIGPSVVTGRTSEDSATPATRVSSVRLDDPFNGPSTDQKTETPGQSPRLFGKRAKLWLIAGVLCVLVATAIFLAKGTFDGLPNGPWGRPVQVKDNAQGTTFLIEIKDAWYLQEGNRGGAQRTFAIVYSCKNLGPREGVLSISRRIQSDSEKSTFRDLIGQNSSPSASESRIEIKTDKGRIHPGLDFVDLWKAHGPKLDLGEWHPVLADGKVDSSGESAFLFSIPADETPVELLTPAWLGLSRKLPETPFPTRSYSDDFGFLPEEPEKAVARLVKAINNENASIALAALHAVEALHGFKAEYVPELREVLAGDRKPLELRSEAATILGELGPPAKDALPALHDVACGHKAPFLLPGDVGWKAFQKAVHTALEKIGGRESLVAALTDAIEKKVNLSESAHALGALGPDAKRAVPSLTELLRIAGQDGHHDRPLQGTVVEALSKIVGEREARKVSDEINRQNLMESQERQAAYRRQLRESSELAKTQEKLRRLEQSVRQQEQGQRTKGLLTDTWRDKNGLNFFIEEDENGLTIKFSGYDSFLRKFQARLTPQSRNSDSFEGSALAEFNGRPSYRHPVTATLDKSGQLQLECPEWPERKGHGTKTLKATLTRQGESSHAVPGKPSLRAGSAARARRGH